MRIQMLTRAAGPTFNANPGDVLNVDDKLGTALIRARAAINLEKIQTTIAKTIAPAEAAVGTTGRGRPKKSKGVKNGSETDNGGDSLPGNIGRSEKTG